MISRLIRYLSNSDIWGAGALADFLKIIYEMCVSFIFSSVLTAFFYVVVRFTPDSLISVQGPISVGPLKITPWLALTISLTGVMIAGFRYHGTFDSYWD